MAFGLGDNQKVYLSVVGTDEKNNPSAPPEGPFVWSVSDETILAIDHISDDTMSVEVRAVGPLGFAEVKVSQVGGNLTGSGEIQVIATEAIALSLISGIPEHQ